MTRITKTAVMDVKLNIIFSLLVRAAQYNCPLRQPLSQRRSLILMLESNYGLKEQRHGGILVTITTFLA